MELFVILLLHKTFFLLLFMFDIFCNLIVVVCIDVNWKMGFFFGVWFLCVIFAWLLVCGVYQYFSLSRHIQNIELSSNRLWFIVFRLLFVVVKSIFFVFLFYFIFFRFLFWCAVSSFRVVFGSETDINRRRSSL